MSAGHHQRLSIHYVAPAAIEAVLGLEHYVRTSDLPAPLNEVVRARASQINGCAFCLDMHFRDTRDGGAGQWRLDVLLAWREAPGLFGEKEQAALALTEAVTLVGREGAPDGVWEGAAKHFVEVEIVSLLMAIATISVWNRSAVSTDQALPGRRHGDASSLDEERVGNCAIERPASSPDRCSVPAAGRAAVDVGWASPQALPEEGEEHEHEQLRYPRLDHCRRHRVPG